MITASTIRAENLPRHLADQMARLTNGGSDNSRWLSALAAGICSPDMPEDLVYAVMTKDVDYEINVIGWASIHLWQGVPALEGYTAQEYRGCGVASLLCGCLTLAVPVDKTATISVFSPAFVKVSQRLGFSQTQQWKRVEDGFVRVE